MYLSLVAFFSSGLKLTSAFKIIQLTKIFVVMRDNIRAVHSKEHQNNSLYSILP